MFGVGGVLDREYIRRDKIEYLLDNLVLGVVGRIVVGVVGIWHRLYS